MPDAAWWASALGFAVAMSATPGPNTAMVMASSATFGLRATVPHVLGITLGFPLLLGLVSLGAAGVLAAQPALLGVLR